MNILDQVVANRYALYHGDSVEITTQIPDNSIHYTLFSPPFSQLYTYSNSDRDMGNSKNDEEFYNHFKFLASELYRITMPGRLLSFHCMILSRLVDTFFSRISLTMPPAPKSHNTAYVLPWEEPLHWQSRSSGYSSS